MAYGTNSVSVIESSTKGSHSYDIRELYKKVDAEVDRMNKQGYKVVSVTPITGSDYDNSENQSYGESFTTAILIVFEAIE